MAGGCTLRGLGVTGRCVIPTTDQATGIRDHATEEPRATLLQYRPLPYGDGPHGGPVLGIWAAPLGLTGVVQLEVGQPVAVLARATTPITPKTPIGQSVTGGKL